MGGGGSPGSPQAGLPFGGIPHGAAERGRPAAGEEPERGESEAVFTQLPTEHEKKRLSLTSLLMEYPVMLRPGRLPGRPHQPVHPARARASCPTPSTTA